jgi:hypothetical protein
VRSLAQRSAQAAKEIKGLIEDSVSRVNTGSVLVEPDPSRLRPDRPDRSRGSAHPTPRRFRP